MLLKETTLHPNGQHGEQASGSLGSLIEALRREVARGLFDCHVRANKNAGKALEIASFCYALIDLLQEKGIITFGELDDRQKAVNKRLVRKFADQGLGVVAMQEFKKDKYSYPGSVEIDCASRLSACRAACCRFDLALSEKDLKEGILKWDLGRPYLIARDEDGYCRHIDRNTWQCTVWHHRPIPCRGYDCRKDQRVWLSFEEGIINPDFDALFTERVEMEL